MSIADHDVTVFNETTSFTRRVVQVINYPTWNGHDTGLVQGDLALIKLDIPVDFSRSASPVCLPEISDGIPANELATVIGWGITEFGDLSPILKKVEITLMSTSVL